MSLHILVLIALVPFALIAFFYREAHVDLRQALLWVASLVAVIAVTAAIFLEV